MRTILIIIACLVVSGCQTDFMGFPPPTSTTSPTAKQVQYCRDVMYINPDLDIEPSGFFLRPGMDDTIRFKFIAKTNDPSQLFESDMIAATDFKPDFGVYALSPNARDSWWDIATQKLTGGNFSVPSRTSAGSRGLNVGYFENSKGTLTVYILWHET